MLGVSWQVLGPKVEYLCGGEVGVGLDEIAAAPAVLCQSLERKMRPRFGALRAAGRGFGSMSSVLCPTDETFVARFGVQLAHPTPGSEETQA